VTRGEEQQKTLREKVDEKNERLKKLRAQLERKDREIEGLHEQLAREVTGAGAPGIEPENMVWIFGYGRTGSTWLSAMMGEMKDHSVWFEPSVGELFGNLYYLRAREGQLKSRQYILGSQRETWIKPMRSFVLDVASARFPEVLAGGYLVVKEPHGSIGAPLLMEALPESRMVLLIRDPRDMVASSLDAFTKGSWAFERTHKDSRDEVLLATDHPDAFVEMTARNYMQHMGNAKQAYDAHEGRKALVRYEDLRADTLGVMKRIYSSLEMVFDEEELVQAVEKHAWEGIPEDKKGQGKFYRSATPGGWREDLTPEQAKTVESITASLLEELYA
jgi:hypothetical protein